MKHAGLGDYETSLAILVVLRFSPLHSKR